MQATRTPTARKAQDRDAPLCPTSELMDFLGRRHMLHILRMFGTRETLRFHEIMKELGSSPNTLALRLGELVEGQVLTREVFAEVPPRVDYRLTEKGRALLKGVMAFDLYLQKYAVPLRTA